MMIKYFCKPRIKVGTEWVTKGQSCEQVWHCQKKRKGTERFLIRQLEQWAVSLVPSLTGSSSGCKLSMNHGYWRPVYKKFIANFLHNLLINSPRIIKCNDTLIDAT